jgi:chromosome segregation ATPase
MSRPVSLNKTNEQQKQLTNYQEQVHLKKQNRQLIEENSVLLNEKQAITQNLTELQTVYQSSQQKLEQSQQNYEGTRTILEQLQLDYDDLKEKLKEKIFRLEEVESIFEKQKNYEKSLRDELEIKLDKINSLEKENGEFEQKVSGLEIDQNKLSQELEYVKELQLETNKQNILLQKEKSRLEQDLTELEIISENYYRSSQQSIKQVQNNYSDLQEKLQEVNQLNVELNKKKTQLEKINSELEINLVELNDELNSLQTKFTKQESELMKERQKNRELRENLQREILIKEELIRLQKKLIDSAVEEALSEERIKVKKEEIIRLKNELESLGNDKKKIEKINELSKQVEILENERIKKEGVKNELQTRIKSLITNLDSLESELSESINKIKSKLNLSDKDSDLI